MKTLIAVSLCLVLNSAVAGLSITGTWAGDVINCYYEVCMSGFSWFQVKPNNRYVAHTIAKLPGANCQSYDPEGWTGTLYPIDKNTFWALNDGATEGYVLQVSINRQSATSIYMGSEPWVIERNQFFKTKLDSNRLLKLIEPILCKE